MKKVLISNLLILFIVFLGVRLENWATTYNRYLYLDGDDTISYKSTLTAIRAVNGYINNLCQFPDSKAQAANYKKCRDFYMESNGWLSTEYASKRGKKATDALYGWKGKLSSYVISFFGSYSFEYENNSYSNKEKYIIDRKSRFKS